MRDWYYQARGIEGERERGIDGWRKRGEVEAKGALKGRVRNMAKGEWRAVTVDG